MASLTDPPETLHPWKTRAKIVRYKNRLSVQYCGRRARCPSSSAHHVTLRIQRSAGGPRAGRVAMALSTGVEHSWWETVNYLYSSLRVWAVSSGQSPWPCEGTDTERRDSPPAGQDPNRTCWMFHHSAMSSDLFKERSKRSFPAQRYVIITWMWCITDKNNHEGTEGVPQPQLKLIQLFSFRKFIHRLLIRWDSKCTAERKRLVKLMRSYDCDIRISSCLQKIFIKSVSAGTRLIPSVDADLIRTDPRSSSVCSGPFICHRWYFLHVFNNWCISEWRKSEPLIRIFLIS